jgi:hypothetical protein
MAWPAARSCGKRGKAQTLTHDYKRRGTTTLFAALDVASGNVIGQCLPRHRNDAFAPGAASDRPQRRHPQAPQCQELAGWTKSADEILDSIKRFCLRISSSGH